MTIDSFQKVITNLFLIERTSENLTAHQEIAKKFSLTWDENGLQAISRSNKAKNTWEIAAARLTELFNKESYSPSNDELLLLKAWYTFEKKQNKIDAKIQGSSQFKPLPTELKHHILGYLPYNTLRSLLTKANLWPICENYKNNSFTLDIFRKLKGKPPSLQIQKFDILHAHVSPPLLSEACTVFPDLQSLKIGLAIRWNMQSKPSEKEISYSDHPPTQATIVAIKPLLELKKLKELVLGNIPEDALLDLIGDSNRLSPAGVTFKNEWQKFTKDLKTTYIEDKYLSDQLPETSKTQVVGYISPPKNFSKTAQVIRETSFDKSDCIPGSEYSVCIENKEITDNDLFQYRNIENLRYLSLAGCTGFTGSGLKHLMHLPITHINLQKSSFHDNFLPILLNFKSLEYLDISYCKNLGFSIEPLKRLQTLKCIHLKGISEFNIVEIEELVAAIPLLETDIELYTNEKKVKDNNKKHPYV